jgi:glycine/D-amino acid oxidase-like deaminating enzyme
MATTCGIVGLGGLALAIAHQCATAGFDTTVIGQRDRGGLVADTQRNHGWKQSGLLYEATEEAHVRAMQRSGDSLLSEAGLPNPTLRGVFAIPRTNDARDHLIGIASRLHLLDRIEPLKQGDARRTIGELFRPDRHYFWVPDTSFDAAKLLTQLRQLLIKRGVDFRVVEEPVRLDVSRGVPTIIAEGVELRFDVTVLAAGAGLPDLLRGLIPDGELSVWRSALLVIEDSRDRSAFDAALFVDRVTDLAVVRHSNRLVVGSRHRRKVNPCKPRVVTAEEQEEVLSVLPPRMRRQASKGRWTAGHKTEHVDAAGNPSVKPWMVGPAKLGVPGLFAALPGKLTLAWHAANEVVASILEGGLQLTHARPATVGSDWTDQIDTHFSPRYDHMDDAEGLAHITRESPGHVS